MFLIERLLESGVKQEKGEDIPECKLYSGTYLTHEILIMEESADYKFVSRFLDDEMGRFHQFKPDISPVHPCRGTAPKGSRK